MLPADRTLQEISANLRDAQRRIERLETLEFAGTGVITCLSTTVTSGAGVSSVTFSSINQNYKHLWLWIAAHVESVGPGADIYMRFNGDTSNNYQWFAAWHAKLDDGTPTETFSFSSTFPSGIAAGATGPADSFVGTEINIYNYRGVVSGSFRRPVTWKSGARSGASGEIQGAIGIGQGHGLWLNTSAAITSITLLVTGTFKFKAGSVFTLIGICPA